MDAKELQLKSVQELHRLEHELRASLLQGRFHLATRQMSKLTKQREARVTLSRVMTVLHQKQSAN